MQLMVYTNRKIGYQEDNMEDLLQLKDKNIVIMGVANERSIAWGSGRIFE